MQEDTQAVASVENHIRVAFCKMSSGLGVGLGLLQDVCVSQQVPSVIKFLGELL